MKIERKCHDAKGRWINGLCHGFFQVSDGPNDAGPVAVIEMMDGTVTTVNADTVVFDAPDSGK